MCSRLTRVIVATVVLVLAAILSPISHGGVLAAQQGCGGRHDLAIVASPDAASTQAVAAIACATSLVRGISARTPILVRLVDAAGLRAAVTQIVAADTATRPISGTTVALQLLGALGPKDDLAAIRRSQYSPSTTAQYSITNRTLYVLASKGHYSPLDRAVIAREYVHALQDQAYGLSSLLADGGDSLSLNSDALLARRALVEGDAYNAMLSYAAATYSRQDLFALNQQLQKPGTPVADFPHDEIGFPASQGTFFVRALAQAASQGMHGDSAQAAGNAALDRSLRNPPTATSEILNPALYIRQAPDDNLPIPAPYVGMDPGWTATASDVLGAFGIGDLLAQHTVPASVARAAAQAAKGWQGDRWLLYQRPANNDALLLWHLRLAAPADALAFEQALAGYTGTRLRAILPAVTRLNWYTAGYCIAVRVQGNEVAVALSTNKNLLNLESSALASLGFL